MFRKRLSVRTGCLRCRKRKKKCDEKKPACGYCARWNLECSWPQALPPSSSSRQIPSRRAAQSALSTSLVGQGDGADNVLSLFRVGGAVLDPFHELPVPNDQHRYYITDYLRHFFTNMISGALPFDMHHTRTDLARGWARSVYGDVAVCYAFAAYSARLQSQTAIGLGQERHALEFGTHALAALRRRLDPEVRPTEQTILLASLHFVMLAFDQLDVQELCRVSRGIAAMVADYGGYAHGLRTMQLSTIQSIEICDMFCVFLTGTKPWYQQPEAPAWPPSLNDLDLTSWSHAELQRRCESDVLDVVRDMALILFFRHPSRQARKLSPAESLYLHQLLRYSENRLGFLQVQYEGAGTLSEVMVHVMIVLKLAVVPVTAQHVVLTTATLQRLHTATLASSTTAVHNDELHQDVLMWACVVALAGPTPGDTRTRFLDIMERMLQLRYGSRPWPCQWQNDLRKGLTSILWHARLEDQLSQVYDTFKNDDHIHTSTP